jgi:hypothetical protein
MQALVLIVQGDLRAAFRVFAEDNKVVTKGLEDQYRALNNVNDGLANQYRQLVLLSQAPTGGGGGGGSFLPTFTPGAGGAGTGGAATVPTIRGLSSSQIQTLKDDLGLISQFGGVIEGLNEKFGDPFFGFGKGFNVAESIRTGIPVTNRNPRTTPTVNVNVTGNLIDPAGAARAIAEVIKNEGARNGNLPLVSEFIAQ